jgi:two-component system chemotaxis response regulator CheY
MGSAHLHEGRSTMAATVLVVDDSTALRRLVCTTLRCEGFVCLEAADGVEALERLGNQSVELVLTDQWMEGMDGLELTKAIKASSNLRRIPVIVLTTDLSPNRREALQRAGALGVLGKTIDPEVLVRTVRRAINAD